jgi:integrase
MRTPELEPVKVAGRKKPWRLNIPASLSPDGKRQQLFFRSEEKAKQHVAGIRDGHKTHGAMIGSLNHHQISEAVRAVDLLRPHGIGLLDAVRAFVADHERRTASKTFGEVWIAFLASKERSEDYLASLRHTKAKVEHLMDSPVVDLRPDDLEAALNGLPPSTRDLRINRLRSVLAYAIRKGWITENPADRLDMSGKKPHEVAVYAAADIQRLLDACRVTDAEFLPFLAVCAFTGLRPENEAFSIKWSDIHLDAPEPHLVVRADTSKTRERRTVDLSENAVAWLRLAKSKTGRVFPFSASTLARKRSDLMQKVNEATDATKLQWLKDGLRHTFASAHMAKFGDATKTMLAMGHKDLKMIWKNYYRHMTAEEAEKFWGIVPKG